MRSPCAVSLHVIPNIYVPLAICCDLHCFLYHSDPRNSIYFLSCFLSILNWLAFGWQQRVGYYLQLSAFRCIAALSQATHINSQHTRHFFTASLTSVFHMLVYCAGVEADVPCSSDIQLSPEHLGENWEDCESIHPPLLPIPPDTHFCDPEMVVQAVRQAGKLHRLLNH